MTRPISDKLKRYLEDSGDLKHFKEDFEKISRVTSKSHPKYADTLREFLELCLMLNEEQKDYVVLGGLATAAHIYAANPSEFILWRGTDDIDLLADKKEVEGIIRALGYEFRESVRRKGAIGNIYDFVKDIDGTSVKIGLRGGVEVMGRDFTQRLYRNASTVGVYSVPIKVPTLRDLVEMKRYSNRKKDRKDIELLKKLYGSLR